MLQSQGGDEKPGNRNEGNRQEGNRLTSRREKWCDGDRGKNPSEISGGHSRRGREKKKYTTNCCGEQADESVQALAREKYAEKPCDAECGL